MRKILCLIALFFLFLLFPTSAIAAANIVLQSDKTTLSSPNEEFEVNATLNISTANGTAYYLRGTFSKPNTTSYCGYTWNNTSWFSGPYSNNEGWKNFLQISVTDDTWIGKLKAKLDPETSACNETGDYVFKIQRFTSGGSANFDDQNALNISIVVPSVTPTPTEVPAPTNVPTPTKTPTPTKSPTPIPTKTPTPTPLRPSGYEGQAKTPTPIPKNKITGTGAMPTSVLGAKVSATPTPKSEVLVGSAQSNNIFKVFAIIIGSICIFVSIIYIFLKTKKNEQENTNQ